MAASPRRGIWNAVWKAGATAVLVLSLVQCDLTEPVERRSLVVEAFLETGQTLPTVTLREAQPLSGAGDGAGDAARNADITLEMDGNRVFYVATNEDAGRYRPVSTAGVVPSRVPWELTVEWNGEVARASGTTPPPIELIEMCVSVPEAPVQAILVDSLRRDSLDIPAEEGFIYPIDVSLGWSPIGSVLQPDTSHWVRPRLRPDTTESSSRIVNFFLEPVEVRREDRFRLPGRFRRWQGVYAIPVEDSATALPGHDLTATLVRGDTSFAAFARSRTDPDRREPISNVRGGLGIATAVSVDSIRRPVEPGLDECFSRAGPFP